MKGYWKHKKATSEVFEKDWLKTGDIGLINEEGFYSIVDRLKDMIIVSGFKVWPNDVEEILLTHPSILEAAVVGFKTELGTKLKAILVKKPDAKELTLEELREQYRYDLFDDFLPFLDKFVIDHEHGGFMCNTDRDGTNITKNKRAWYEGRGIWVYSFLYNNFEPNPKYLEIAH